MDMERTGERMGMGTGMGIKMGKPQLNNAAKFGDVKYLKTLIASKPNFFSSLYLNEETNIFHIAVKGKKVEFFKEAMNLLPTKTKLELLACEDQNGWNPLHYLASHRWFNLELVQSIVSFYKSLVYHPFKHYSKPWLACVDINQTPLHLALKTEDHNYKGRRSKLQINEDCALEILSLDIDLFCSDYEFERQSLLCFAVRFGLSRLALKILTSSSSYALHGEHGFTPLHYAPRCSEKVLELLLKKHPEMIDIASHKEGYCVLHKWALLEISFSTVVLNDFPDIKTKLFGEAIHRPDRNGCNALHLAADNPDTDEIARNLIQGHQNLEITHNKTPWTAQDNCGNTPLHLALSSKNQELASYILSLDTTLYDVNNNEGESPLYVAVANGCDQFVEEVLNKGYPPRYKILHRNDDSTVLHNLYNLTEETGRKLLEKYWWIMNSRDNKGSTALDKAIENNASWLVELLKDPSSLVNKDDFDWAEACKNNETLAVRKFIDNCQNLVTTCREKQDTPLHHITLPNRQQYLELLMKPSIDEVKNLRDSNGDTPLHRALKREDKELAKALLSDEEVRQDIKNNDGKTAKKLLQKLYNDEDWKMICEQYHVYPFSNTGYITSATDLGEMRTALSVVAALLATITFAAAFTLPGGFNDTTGEAILAKKAAFIAFLISDTYALCTSILVLFLLIRSMASTRGTSSLMVDRSVFLLAQALYGTMATLFMTGIYLVIAHNSLWATIVIFIMCSFTGILVTMYQLQGLAKLIPTMAKR